jgi:hypothetical protein
LFLLFVKLVWKLFAFTSGHLANANELSNGSGALAPPKRDEAKATIP